MPHRVLVAQQLASLFSILSHPLRIRILMELRAGELCVNSLQEILGIRQSSVSQNLAILRSNNLIKERRDGRRVLYRLSSTKVASWLVDGIPLIVPDDTDSALLKTAVQRAMTLWSEDEFMEEDSARRV